MRGREGERERGGERGFSALLMVTVRGKMGGPGGSGTTAELTHGNIAPCWRKSDVENDTLRPTEGKSRGGTWHDVVVL